MMCWELNHTIQHVCPSISEKPVKKWRQMDSEMTESGMEYIRSDVNERGWFSEEKNGVDSKEITNALI